MTEHQPDKQVSSKLQTGEEFRGARSTSGLGQPSVAALAEIWSPMPQSMFRHEELVEGARVALGKYDLEPQQLDEAAPILAKAIHMRIEQNGGNELNEHLRRDIEYEVLKWCGFRKEKSPDSRKDLRR